MITSRTLTGICRSYPLLAFVPGLLLGEAIGARGVLALNLPMIVGVLSSVLLLVVRQNPRGLVGTVVLSIIIGYTLGVFSIPVIGGHKPVTDRSYLAQVVREPRYPMPGRRIVFLKLIGVVSGDSGEELEVEPLTPPVSVQCKLIDLPWSNSAQLSLGATAIIRAKFTRIEASLATSYERSLLRQGITDTCVVQFASKPLADHDSMIETLRRRLRSQIETRVGDGQRSGLLLSLLIGTRDVLTQKTENAFKQTGLAHLLVVSGYQVTLVFYLVAGIARRALIRVPQFLDRGLVPPLESGLALGFAALFVAIIEADAPSFRALIAVLLVIAGRWLERGSSLYNLVLASLLIVSVIWPCSFEEPSTQLTFAALFGIALGTSGGRSAFGKFIKSSFYASLLTTPVVLFWFGQLSLIGFLLNPILAPPIAAFSCYGGLVGIAMNTIGIDGSGLLLQIVAMLLHQASELVFWLSKIPGSWWIVEEEQRLGVQALLFTVIAVLCWLRLRRFVAISGFRGSEIEPKPPTF